MSTKDPPRRAASLLSPKVVVAMLAVLAFGLRLITYRDALFGDEYFAIQELDASSSPLGLLRTLSSSVEVSPPLYFMLAWLARQANNSITALRLPSIVAGTMLIPVVYAIGRRAAGTSTGLAAAALAAISPFAVWFSGEGRPYALLCLMVALMVLCLLRAVEEATLARYVLLSLVTAGAVYTHYTAVFAIVGGYAWAFAAARGRRRQIVASALGALVLYLPWASSVSGKESLYMYGETWGLGARMARLIAEHTLLGLPFVPLEDVPGLPLAVAAAAAITVGAASRARRLPAPDSPLVLLVLVATVPLAGLAIYSLATNVNLLMVRNMNSAFPAMLVLAAAAVVNAKPRWLAAVTTLTLLGATAISLSSSFEADFRRPDMTAASRMIAAVEPAPAVASNTRFRYYMPAAAARRDVVPIKSPPRVWRDLASSRTPIALVALRWPYGIETVRLRGNKRVIESAGYRPRCSGNIRGLVDIEVTVYAVDDAVLRVPWRCARSMPEPVDPRRKLLATGANGFSAESMPMTGTDYALALLAGAWLLGLIAYLALGASKRDGRRNRT